MTDEIKEILKAAILNDENCVYFTPNSQGTYTVTLWGSIWDVYAVTGQELLDAIKNNKKTILLIALQPLTCFMHPQKTHTSHL